MIGYRILQLALSLLFLVSCGNTNRQKTELSQKEMEGIYNEIKTPFKYGIVFQHPDSDKKIDSPTIFRENDMWYMTYIVFDGQGYETWLAKSDDLLDWKSMGCYAKRWSEWRRHELPDCLLECLWRCRSD